MPKRPDFVPILTATGWMVSVPGNMTGDGKRKRKFFAEEKEAEKFAKGLRGEYQRGQRGGVISHALALMAAESEKILAPFGLTILEAAKAVAAQHAAAGSDETFRERYERFVEQQETSWRDRYAKDMGKIPKWVGEDFMNRRIATITPEILRAALVKHGAKAESTIKARATRVNAALTAKGKKRRAKAIEIMTAGQCAAMLRACRTLEERRAVALLLFAGIRPDVSDGEITRLEWEAIGEEEIYVSHDVSKTGTDRHITITPRLRRLLSGHPREGPVTPPKWKYVCDRLRKAAGISGKVDITRHTFASHYLAAFGEDATKAAMGHTKGSETLFRHYRRSVPKRAGEKFFSVAPLVEKPAEGQAAA